MKILHLAAVAMTALTPQFIDTESTAGFQNEPPSPTTINSPAASPAFLDYCLEITEQKRKACESACAATGKSSTFESAICGLTSTCKCT